MNKWNSYALHVAIQFGSVLLLFGGFLAVYLGGTYILTNVIDISNLMQFENLSTELQNSIWIILVVIYLVFFLLAMYRLNKLRIATIENLTKENLQRLMINSLLVGLVMGSFLLAAAFMGLHPSLEYPR